MMTSSIDHLVYATTDLERSVQELEELFGVRSLPGGKHLQWGTRNVLFPLGWRRYLEVIGPDPEQPAPARERPFGIDGLEGARLTTWAAVARDLEHSRDLAARNGVQLGAVLAGERTRPDGTHLAWRMTDPLVHVSDGLVPFLIDWGNSPHPAQERSECSLIGLRAEHPEFEEVRAHLEALGLPIPLSEAKAAGLYAMLRTPRGLIEIS